MNLGDNELNNIPICRISLVDRIDRSNAFRNYTPKQDWYAGLSVARAATLHPEPMIWPVRIRYVSQLLHCRTRKRPVRDGLTPCMRTLHAQALSLN